MCSDDLEHLQQRYHQAQWSKVSLSREKEGDGKLPKCGQITCNYMALWGSNPKYVLDFELLVQ